VHGAHLLQALTIVLAVAGVTSVVSQRLRQPVVLGYLVAGLIVGPHVAVPLWADPQTVSTLSELGIVLVFFALGLEFNLRLLARVGPRASLTAVIETSLMAWLGFGAGRLLGWTFQECVFAGAIVAISSTTIIARTFAEEVVRTDLRERVVGVLLVEDVIAIALLTALSAQASGQGLSGKELAFLLARLVSFLVAILVLGLWIVPPAMRLLARLRRAETTVVASVGLCFTLALLAQKAGYSVALGAFLAGSLVSESGHGHEVERLIHPLRDVFAAVFFVSVGMLIEPTLVAEHAPEVGLLVLVVVLGKTLFVGLGVFLTGGGTRTAIEAGLSQAQIGEFSFILAGLGRELGVTGPFLFSVAVAVSALTTLATPWLVRGAPEIAAWVDRKLPHRLQTFASLYGSWVERLGSAPRRATQAASIRRLVRLLLLETGLLAAVVIAASLAHGRAAGFLVGELGLDPRFADALVLAAALALAAPFGLGIVRLSRRLGHTLALAALPGAHGTGADTSAAPRRALSVTVQLLIVLVLGAPLVALTQPFLPGPPGLLFLALVLVVFALTLWRRAATLEGHVRASAEVVAEALLKRTHAAQPQAATDGLDLVRELLPGLGELESVELEEQSPAVGRSLAELDLRGRTGASVIAITRAKRMLVPQAHEVLRAGDLLALVGSRDAVTAARARLAGAGYAARPGAPPGSER
jgi:CPA2 family monovalent cation:H+ antiporter-2